MAEADGIILIIAPENILEGFIPNDECGGVAWDDVVGLYEFSESPKPFLELDPYFESIVGEPFATNEIIVHEKGVIVSIFGDLWMTIVKEITLHGKNIELHGVISHEYGHLEFYSLNKNTHYFTTANPENDEDQDEAARYWLKQVPKNIIDSTLVFKQFLDLD